MREALAVASARLLPLDPAAQQLRQQYTASITPPPQAAATADAPATPAAAPAGGGSTKLHPESAAANLLLLDQPAAAAQALASKDGGSNPVALHAAARVAVLAAAHKVCLHATLVSICSAHGSAGKQAPSGCAQQYQLLFPPCFCCLIKGSVLALCCLHCMMKVAQQNTCSISSVYISYRSRGRSVQGCSGHMQLHMQLSHRCSYQCAVGLGPSLAFWIAALYLLLTRLDCHPAVVGVLLLLTG